MRLSRLDLTRFGKFTGRTIEFPAGAADLHVIYGPNEAGKSTLRQALLDWLYGIHPRTAYDFKHGYAAMEIGGVIEDPAGSLAFRRFKRIKNPLLDAEGQPLAEATVARYLANTNRESFERMFAIDHQKLVAGGQSIMDADGDFGRMLFEAAAGVSNLAEIRKLLEGEAKDLWGLPRRKEAQFSQAEDRFTAAKTKLNEVVLSAAQWKAADQALKDAQMAEHAADAELAAYATRQRQLERIQRVATPLMRCHEAQATRTALGVPVSLPAAADVTFRTAETTCAAVTLKRGIANDELAKHRLALGDIILHPALPARKEEITALAAARGVFQKAQSDLPGVERELAETMASLATAARGLAWTEVSPDAVRAKLPSPLVRADLAGHLKLQSDLVHKVDSAHRDRAAKQDLIDGLEAQLAGAPDATELPALTRALTEAQALNYTEALATATAAAASAKTALATCFAAVRPFNGTVSNLLSGTPPTAAETAALTDEHARLDALRESATEQLEREVTALALAEAAVTAHGLDHEPVTATAVQTQRYTRDQHWQRIRRGEQSPTEAGDAYEQEVRAADAIADGRYDDAAHIAKSRELQNTVLTRGIERDGTRQRLNRISAELKRFHQQWEERVTLGCGVFIPLERYPAWLAARDATLAALRIAEDADQAQRALQERAATLSTLLQAALDNAGSPCPAADFPLLVRQAAKVQADRLESRQQQQGWRTARGQHQSAVPGLDRTLAAAEAALNAWQVRRDKLMQAAGVPVTAGSDGATHALEVQIEIEQATRSAASLHGRVTAMESEIATFAAQATALAAACTPDLSAHAPADIAVALDARLRAEEQAATEHARLTKAVAAAEKNLATLATAEADALATLEPLFAAAKVRTVDELRDVVTRWSACHTADTTLLEQRDAVLNNGDGLAFETLAEEVAAEDLSALGAALEAVTRKTSETEAKRKVAVEVRTKAGDALAKYAGQDTAVRHEAERQDALLLMREAAEGHLKLALGAKLLAWAVNRYSERKHEPLLKAASSIFSQLTLGAFERLAVGLDDLAMTLYAYRPDGSHLAIGNGLSTGTEAQLYLALRLASLQQHLATGVVLPFLGDDIFMGWDKERCAAGIEVLAELATRTQVILLTHDEDIAKIAQTVAAGRVSVTELPRDM